MAEKKYKVENKLPFQSMVTNVDTSNQYTPQQMLNGLDTAINWF